MPARSPLPKWPTLTLERAAGGVVCGVDEVGYAPLAGPLVAAAVVLPPGPKPRALRGLTDSKLLSRDERERFHDVVHRLAAVGIGMAAVDEIDRLNIYHADMLAMRRAVDALGVAPDAALVDGRASPPLGCPVTPVIKGDRRSLSIAAASVVAKVTRDRMMCELASRHPGYGWESNVGYGTDAHYLGLLRLGPTQQHRRSFAPLNTLFAADALPLSNYRYAPADGRIDLERLELLELRRDLHAVFDGSGLHVGQVKNQRGRWTFHAVGYCDDGAPVKGSGPCAVCHGERITTPERRVVRELLALHVG